MHKHRKIKGNSRFGSLCGPGRLFCFSMAKKRCLCYTCLSDFACGAEKEKLKKGGAGRAGRRPAARRHHDREMGEQLVHRPHLSAYPEKEHDLK